MQLDLIVENARIATMDDSRPWARDFGVLNGRFVAVDAASNLSARKRIDAGSRLVLPGFADSHNHMSWFGLSRFEVDLNGCTSLDELYQQISEYCASNPDAAVIIGNGYLHSETGRHPDRHRLDAIAGGRPVWLRHGSGHISMVNTTVLEALGLLRSVPEHVAQYVAVDDAGVPTGVLEETAQTLVVRRYTPYRLDHLMCAIEAAGQHYVSEGLTSVTEAGIGAGWISKSPTELQAYQRLSNQGRLPLRVELMPSSDALHDLSGHPDDDLQFGLDLGITGGFGNDRVRIGPMKIWLDGGLASRTARMSESFCDVHSRGSFQDNPATMAETVGRAAQSGWQLAMHVIGDEAVDWILDVLEVLARDLPIRAMRHRFEHAGITSPEQVSRMMRLGITPIIQPAFLWTLGETMFAALGPERSEKLYRARSFIDSGIKLVSSSDRPVAEGAPLKGLDMLLNRRTPAGRIIGGSERIDIVPAIKSYTLNSAWISNAEAERGSIKDRMLADFIIVSDDVIAQPEALESARVVATYLGGECVYES